MHDADVGKITLVQWDSHRVLGIPTLFKPTNKTPWIASPQGGTDVLVRSPLTEDHWQIRRACPLAQPGNAGGAAHRQTPPYSCDYAYEFPQFLPWCLVIIIDVLRFAFGSVTIGGVQQPSLAHGGLGVAPVYRVQ